MTINAKILRHACRRDAFDIGICGWFHGVQHGAILGIEDVNIGGYDSGSGLTCDIVFTPWFKNYKPTMFSAFYQDDLKANPQYKNIFSSEYKTRFWCLNKKYDGTYTWERSSRL